MSILILILLILSFLLMFLYVRKKVKIKIVQFHDDTYGLMRYDFMRFTTKYLSKSDDAFTRVKHPNGWHCFSTLEDCERRLNKITKPYKIIDPKEIKKSIEPQRTLLSSEF